MEHARVMVVEDEGITARDIEARLTRLGYRVPAVAHSAQEALRKAARTRPDLVLMDIKLKGAGDGVEAAEQLRTRFNIPVTYLTAYADESTLQRARATLPYGYLVKPFEERELHATIQMALYRRHLEARGERAGHMLATVNKALQELTPTEERLLRMRFGLASPRRRPDTIAKRMGVEPARARRMTQRALTKLRTMGAPPPAKPAR